jgi:Flp pilus assembly protein TadG
MKHRRESRRATQKGSSVIEFGLCFLLIFGFIYAVFEFGRIVYSYNVLAGATREASRYAMVHGSRSGSAATSDTIRAYVLRWAIGLNPSALNVNTTWPSGNSPGNPVLIQTSYTITPYTTLIIGAPITLGSRSQMVISQ